MADDDAPKTAYEIVLERLRQRDREQGVEARPLTDEQRAAEYGPRHRKPLAAVVIGTNWDTPLAGLPAA